MSYVYARHNILSLLYNRYKKHLAAKDVSTKTESEKNAIFGMSMASSTRCAEEVVHESTDDDDDDDRKREKKHKKKKRRKED